MYSYTNHSVCSIEKSVISFFICIVLFTWGCIYTPRVYAVAVPSLHCKCSSPYINVREVYDKNGCPCINGSYSRKCNSVKMPVDRWYSNVDSYNVVWPNHRIVRKESGHSSTLWVENCMSDSFLKSKLDDWQIGHAYSFASLLGESIVSADGLPKDRANRIVGIRNRAVAKIRELAAKLGQPINQGLLNSDNYTGIRNELKRLKDFDAQRIQAEQARIREEQAREQARVRKIEQERFRKKSEEARLSVERLKRVEASYKDSQKNLESTLENSKRLEGGLKSSQKTIKELVDRIQKQDQRFENYIKQQEEKKERNELLEKRRARLYAAIHDIFDYGKIQDQVMVDFFAKASEFSPRFKKLFEDLKNIPKISRRLFNQKISEFEKISEELFDENEELVELIEQPEQLALDYSEAESFALGDKAGINSD